MALKEKSIAYYIADGYGGYFAVSKNSETRLRKKLSKPLECGEIYSMKSHRIHGFTTPKKHKN